MTTFTENYSLTKPDNEDYYDVADFNENMDTIDSAMAETAAEIGGLGEGLVQIDRKIGSGGEGETLFGLLQERGGLVRSIHRFTYAVPKGSASGSLAFDNPIDPSRSIVLWGRLYENAEKHYSFDYSLSSTALTVSHANYTNAPGLVLDFWVVEFH